MAFALVGTIGAVSLGAANTAVTPAWGTSENRTAKNLLVCWVAVHATATLPGTPAGWSIGVQKAGTSMSVTAYYKVATGTDSAPTIAAMGASTYIQAQLAEFSGGADGAPVANAGVGTAGTTSPIVATLGAIDPTNGTLVVVVGASFYSAAATKTLTHTVTGGAATITASNNNSTSLARHYAFGRGPTTTHGSADSDSFAQTTTSITGGAVGLVSFLLGPPVTSLPTAASLTFTRSTPAVSAAQTYAIESAAGAQLIADQTSVPLVSDQDGSPLYGNLGLALVGVTPTVLISFAALPTAASLTLTPATPAVVAAQTYAVSAAGITLAGATPVVQAAQTYAPSAASLSLIGATPAVSAAQTYEPTSAGLALVGVVPDVTVSSTGTVVLPVATALALVGAMPVVTIASFGGAPALPRFIPAMEQAIVGDDARRERARKRHREKVRAEAQAVIAVAMAAVLDHQRRIEEDDWLLGLTDDAEYVRRAA